MEGRCQRRHDQGAACESSGCERPPSRQNGHSSRGAAVTGAAAAHAHHARRAAAAKRRPDRLAPCHRARLTLTERKTLSVCNPTRADGARLAAASTCVTSAPDSAMRSTRRGAEDLNTREQLRGRTAPNQAQPEACRPSQSHNAPQRSVMAQIRTCVLSARGLQRHSDVSLIGC